MGLEDKYVHLSDHGKREGAPRWTDCEDIEIYEDSGVAVFAGPRYLRCSRNECSSLVTHGMVRTGGCFCGNRRLVVPMRLTTEEKSLLKRGYYPLVQWEYDQIQPSMPEGKACGWGTDREKKKYD